MRRGRIFAILLCVIVMVASFTGCGESEKEVALITDFSQVQDSAKYEAMWDGITTFAKKNRISYKVYVPEDRSDESFRQSIIQSVENGAEIVFCIGYLFEAVVFWAQTEYPEINFVLMDGEPKDSGGEPFYTANTVSFSFSQLEAGFLAGYLAVSEGHRRLGFMGGLSTPETVRYGYGFVQGAESAAEDLQLEYNNITVYYTYFQNFEATPAKETMAKEWYDKYNLDIIFAPCQNAAQSVITAADFYQKPIIIAQRENRHSSKQIVASVEYEIASVTEQILELYYQDKLVGGQDYLFGTTTGAIKLYYDEKDMLDFTQENYNAALNRLFSGRPSLLDESKVKDVLHLDLPYVKVQLVV